MQSHTPDGTLFYFPDEDQIMFSKMNSDSELTVISSLLYTYTIIKKYFQLRNRPITHMLLVATNQPSIIFVFLMQLSEIYVHS